MTKMTKAQAKKRLLEARVKISKVMMSENIPLTSTDRKKMYDICQYLGRYAHGKLR